MSNHPYMFVSNCFYFKVVIVTWVYLMVGKYSVAISSWPWKTWSPWVLAMSETWSWGKFKYSPSNILVLLLLICEISSSFLIFFTHTDCNIDQHRSWSLCFFSSAHPLFMLFNIFFGGKCTRFLWSFDHKLTKFL